MLYRKRNIDLLVSHFALKRNLVKRKRWPGNRDYMVNFHPGKPGSGHRDAEIPASRAEIFPFNREVDF